MRICRFMGAGSATSLGLTLSPFAVGRGGGGGGGGNSGGQQRQPRVQTVSLTGSIDSVGANQLAIKASKERQGGRKTGDAQQWLVNAQSATILVLGYAELSYLHSGQMIQFKAELDEKGGPKDKVSELTVVSVEGNRPGIAADDGKPLPHPGQTNAGGGDAPAKGKGKGKKAADDLDAGKDAAKDAVAAAKTNEKKITAKIGRVAGSKLSVKAGTKAIQIELADGPTINVALTDPTLIVAGSQIRVRGQGMETNNGNLCKADDITVTLLSSLKGKRRPVRNEMETNPAKKISGDAAATETNLKADSKPDAGHP